MERLEHLVLEVLAELQEQEAPGVREALSVQEEQRAQVALLGPEEQQALGVLQVR